MVLRYVRPETGSFRQGEIIENLFEFRPMVAPDEPIDPEGVLVTRVDYPRAIVITQDCDLDWDYKARHGEAAEHKLLDHVLLCGLFAEVQVRGRPGLAYHRVQANQDERYHCFATAEIDGVRGDPLPELVADFKRVFALPVEFAYWLTSESTVVRRCIVPSLYLQDFVHRLYSFLARVAIP